MNFYSIGHIFNKEAHFPLDEKLVIITGINGSGKTYTLDLLNEYLTTKKEDVLYFTETRRLNCDVETITSMRVINSLTDNEQINRLLDRCNFSPEDLKYCKQGEIIRSGSIQICNMLGQIYNNESNDLNVLIDIPERSLHVSVQLRFVESILKFSKIKRLIIVTHSPEICSENETVDITSIVNIN